ncbi:MAG: cytochrome-c peroxidase [Phycisphaeraceae bacterium]|nr:cytochrome-c peroxidase [Phycisphaeraceae bacterium]MCB9848681.1 cytochrome-c peroxidase [Phycisphaeraceae bacterium]
MAYITARSLHPHAAGALLGAGLSVALTGVAAAQVIDLNNLDNYANQPIPAYITKQNTTPGNPITDEGATLGRILFYDVRLSSNDTVACASCHRQERAFSDLPDASIGVNGTTGRHSMRLVNSRFGTERRFFWDERANTLEDQATMPIQDHNEMGFSGANGDPGIGDLIAKLEATSEYPALFEFVFGDSAITESRMQLAMAQFMRSIQSFDSKYDAGRAVSPGDGPPFPNFTINENNGKQLFLAPPAFGPGGQRIGGGAGCAGCHRPPEFDIDPLSLNNGVIGAIGGGTDITVTRSPTMRDLINPDGTANAGFMHTNLGGTGAPVNAAINHYNNGIILAPVNTNLDPRLTPGGSPQRLNLTPANVNDMAAFLRTLTGSNVYTDPKWSSPFTPDGSLTILGLPVFADINGDGVVDTADLGILIALFGRTDDIADLNNDGTVDTADLGILLGRFGATS